MKDSPMNKEQYSSLRNALRILNLFSNEKPELQLKDIMMGLGVGKSTAFRLVHTLTEEGFLIRDFSSKSYRLAASLLAMEQTIIHKMDICRLSTDIIENLSEETGETAHIAIIQDLKVLYLLKVDSSNPINILIHKRNPLHCTSTGQVLLAYQPDSVIDQVINKGFTSYTSKTITDPLKLKNLLRTIKLKGYAVSKEELREGAISIAAPVKNIIGEVIASVSIAGPISRINQHTLPNLVKKVQQAADEITKRFR